MSRFLLLFVATLMSVLTLTACGGDKEDPPPAPVQAAAQGNPEQGKQIFASTCAACHGPNGEGVQGLGKNMQQSEFIASLSDEELLAFIKQGRPISDPKNTTGVDMPPKGGNPALSDEQLRDIIAYMRSIHQ
jgi:mono/diheme cytochrome c family protein